MSRAGTALDLISNLALAAAAAMLVVRPQTVSQVAPLARKAGRLTRLTTRRLASRAIPHRRQSRPQHLTNLIYRYSPTLRWQEQRDLKRAAARRLNGGAAMLALSVLADSAVEHYRGSFENRAMYTPLVAATLALGASLFGVADPRDKRHGLRGAIYGAAAATGLAGLAFHTYNVLKRPGGLSWSNLFYSAPVGAPAALTLSGILGRGAEHVRDAPLGGRAAVLGLPAGRTLAAVTAAGLVGTVGEAGLLHFRGAYQNPAMFVPVTVPPIAAVSLAAAALRPNPAINRIARCWLRLTALLGMAGVGFHAYGVSRNMGGWRNWSQNVLNGPPLPAPPSFTGLALAGLAALSLMDGEGDG